MSGSLKLLSGRIVLVKHGVLTARVASVFIKEGIGLIGQSRRRFQAAARGRFCSIH